MRTRDGRELFGNVLSGVVPEITGVKRIMMRLNIVDVRSGRLGQVIDVRQGGLYDLAIFVIIAFNCGALLEVEFALGDVGYGDGDGIGGVGLDGVVESDYLETRDRVERESSRPRGREIVCGEYCERVRFIPSRERRS